MYVIWNRFLLYVGIPCSWTSEQRSSRLREKDPKKLFTVTIFIQNSVLYLQYFPSFRTDFTKTCNSPSNFMNVISGFFGITMRENFFYAHLKGNNCYSTTNYNSEKSEGQHWHYYVFILGLILLASHFTVTKSSTMNYKL